MRLQVLQNIRLQFNHVVCLFFSCFHTRLMVGVDLNEGGVESHARSYNAINAPMVVALTASRVIVIQQIVPSSKKPVKIFNTLQFIFTHPISIDIVFFKFWVFYVDVLIGVKRMRLARHSLISKDKSFLFNLSRNHSS